MKKAGIILMIIVGLAVLAFANFYFKGNQQNMQTATPKTLKVGDVTLNIEVANTDAARAQGLSGRAGLAENQGMLFIFDIEGYYGFWMKDMKFAIDMAWISKDKKIVFMESNVLPETYPKIFTPNVTSLYVLEIPAGFLVKNNVKIGDQVAF